MKIDNGQHLAVESETTRSTDLGACVTEDIYLSDENYETFVAMVRLAMQFDHDTLDARRADLAVLVLSAVQLTDTPEKLTVAALAALAEALVQWSPPTEGDIDVRDVRFIVGDVADIFPARLRASEQAAAA